MRSPEFEIKKILSWLDSNLEVRLRNTNAANLKLAQTAFDSFHAEAENGLSVDRSMELLLPTLVTLPLPQEYFEHFLTSCSHCVQAAMHQRRNSEIEAWIQIVDATAEAGVVLAYSVSSFELAEKSVAASQRARKAAEVRHAKSGGSLDKKNAIQAAWASGKYSNRDLCAEQECAGLNVAFGTARKALRNTPEPPRRCDA